VIDFRYHLVSLVSVFMALAIGVVLGAGPLQGSIGDQLSSQVDDLVRDKADLQQAVENRDDQISDRDTFIAAVGADLTAGRLAGREVVLVTLVGADSGAVEALADQLEQAGAAVTGRVAVTPRWTDPEQAAFRQSLAAQLLPFLAPAQTPDPTAGADAELAAVLAAAVLTPAASDGTADGGSETGGEAAQAQTLLDGLTGGELVGVDGEPQARADLAVVVGGNPQESVGADDPDWARAAAGSHLALMAALDGSAGAVLAGPVGATQDDGVLRVLRGDALAGVVSGVDSADTAMGRVTTVLALAGEADGRSGQYGFGEDAAAPVPDDVPADGAPADAGGEDADAGADG
jgi:hypothetical protein